MNLNELIPQLKPYRAIIVTGPQRSGTTVAAHILAHELGYRYVDEDEFQIHDHNKAYMFLKEGNVVLQAPALCHTADQFAKYLNYAVVMMRRDLDDIRKSEDRIHWRESYGGLNWSVEAKKYSDRFGIVGDNIAELKYWAWDNLQKQTCTSFDLEYESLRGHPLWASERKDFAPRQYQKENGNGNERETSRTESGTRA